MLYADYNGSSPLLPSVKEYIQKRINSDLFANPNAIHSLGQKIYSGIEKSRKIISEVLGAFPDQVIFTSGASEGISTVLHSVLSQSKDKKIVITSPLEHPSVARALDWYKEEREFKILELEIDSNGVINLDHLESLVLSHKNDVALITIMACQNETGVLQPTQRIAEICSKNQILFFSDTTQFIGKLPFNFESSGMDFAVCSGHKIGALSGSGVLLAKDPTLLRSLVFGSNQESGHRGGTQHYLGIETLAVALNDFQKNYQKLKTLEDARLWFETQIKKEFPQVVIIAETAQRLPGTTLIGLPGLHGQAVQIELESNDVFVTTSAACTDNQPETSHVLRAMGVKDGLGRSVIRISLSYGHGMSDYENCFNALKKAYNKLIKIHSY